MKQLHEQRVAVTKAALMAIAERLIDFVIKKNTDYGDSWQSYGIFIPAIRMKDKLVRVETLIDGRQALVADETFEDTIKDIVAYGWLAMLRIEYERYAKQQDIIDKIVQLPLPFPQSDDTKQD